MAVIEGIAGLAGLAGQNPYGTSSKGQWNLARGIYTRSDQKSIVFFYETAADEGRSQRTALDQVQDTGGRRLALYEYAYRDGQRVQDLGRKGETFNFQIKFFGLDYQRKFQDFIQTVVNTSLGGTIVHPVRGAMTVRFRDYEYVHRFDEWNAVTIRATFVEDTTDQLVESQVAAPSTNSALRDGVQILADVQTNLSKAINDANLINVGRATLKARLDSVTAQVSQLMGRLISTFSSDAKLKSLSAQGAAAGGLTNLNGGKVTTGTGASATLPPVLQTGFDQATQNSILAQQDAYVQASQVSVPQAVFQTNQARQAIGAAITEAEGLLGVDAFQISLTYRQLAIAVQTAVEASISTSQTLVRFYKVPRTMSLRTLASLNGLSVDRQNDIADLNPDLGSINLVPAGTTVTLPAA